MDNLLAGQRISLCMIVKNEIDWLPGCLESVKDIVAEIVIVDTGSTDGTVELAGKFTSRIKQIAWIEDFSHARNVALDMAAGDWVLAMDADSSLGKDCGHQILQAVREPDVLACNLVMRNHFEGGDRETFLCTPLFRRLPNLRYSGKVHEQVTPALKELMLSNPLWRCATLDTVFIEHYGYMHEQTKLGKRSRNIELLRKSLADDPSDIYRRFKLAQALGAENDTGFPHLAAALEALLRLSPGQIREQAFAHELMANGALRLAGRNQPRKALEISRLTESLFGKHPVTSFARALSHYLSRDGKSSLQSANEALTIARPPGSFVCNPEWLREDLYLLIAQILQDRGEYSRAVETLKAAVAEFADSRRMALALIRTGLAARMPLEALNEGARWLTAHGPDKECLLLCADAAQMHGDTASAAKWRSMAGAL